MTDGDVQFHSLSPAISRLRGPPSPTSIKSCTFPPSQHQVRPVTPSQHQVRPVSPPQSIKSGSPMLGVLGPLSSQTKLFSSRTKPRGDSFIFRMHYRTTFVFIMGCCLLVTATQYLGDKIACLVDKDALPQKVIDTYCFISSTFTLPATKDMEVSEPDRAPRRSGGWRSARFGFCVCVFFFFNG